MVTVYGKRSPDVQNGGIEACWSDDKITDEEMSRQENYSGLIKKVKRAWFFSSTWVQNTEKDTRIIQPNKIVNKT